jgi:hypothetical protein
MIEARVVGDPGSFLSFDRLLWDKVFGHLSLPLEKPSISVLDNPIYSR